MALFWQKVFQEREQGLGPLRGHEVAGFDKLEMRAGDLFRKLGSAGMRPHGIVPAGHYQIDPDHCSITFDIDHFKYSRFTMRFDRKQGQLDWNEGGLDRSTASVTMGKVRSTNGCLTRLP